ncbi:50S ribosomal protein L3 [Candidatus Roizmanbacteria bacterium]|nr:50S ribosomal protein L3 [Candidatus Roizmanbacteria bacterium]
MIGAILGTKIRQTQAFNAQGHRTPVTVISAGPCWVTQVKTVDTDGYAAVQLGFGQKSLLSKPQTGHITKAGLDKQAPRFFREVHVDAAVISDKKMKPGDAILVDQVLQPGDIVSVTGTSKGKGFAGVVKRWKFKGGPKTHGQSDRLRAPGSIGPGTTPGRVYKGKKMAGRMGTDTITVKNLHVVSINKDTNEVVVSGVVPGPKRGLLRITVLERTEKPVQQAEKASETNQPEQKTEKTVEPVETKEKE